MSKKTCLIIDDVNVSRYSNRIVAESLGFEVADAESAREGLAKAELKVFDVVLVDWHLRQDSGLDLIRKLKEHPAYNKTAFIVCTGVENATAASDEARQAGATGFIFKPATREKLEAELRKTAA